MNSVCFRVLPWFMNSVSSVSFRVSAALSAGPDFRGRELAVLVRVEAVERLRPAFPLVARNHAIPVAVHAAHPHLRDTDARLAPSRLADPLDGPAELPGFFTRQHAVLVGVHAIERLLCTRPLVAREAAVVVLVEPLENGRLLAGTRLLQSLARGPLGPPLRGGARCGHG